MLEDKVRYCQWSGCALLVAAADEATNYTTSGRTINWMQLVVTLSYGRHSGGGKQSVDSVPPTPHFVGGWTGLGHDGFGWAPVPIVAS